MIGPTVTHALPYLAAIAGVAITTVSVYGPDLVASRTDDPSPIGPGGAAHAPPGSSLADRVSALEVSVVQLQTEAQHGLRGWQQLGITFGQTLTAAIPFVLARRRDRRARHRTPNHTHRHRRTRR